MKTTMKAAILLLSGAIFFSQASLAGKGKPNDKPPPKDDCTFEAKATYCSDELQLAHDALKIDVFKNSRDQTALQCKVADADLKISDGKFADAERKLFDSVTKIDTLYRQGKILDAEGNPDPVATAEMIRVMGVARLCADDLADNP